VERHVVVEVFEVISQSITQYKHVPSRQSVMVIVDVADAVVCLVLGQWYEVKNGTLNP